MDSSDSHHKHHKPSNSELLSSAKLVAEAARATLNHESDKIDKAKFAGAAGDLLSAASDYGKLEEKSFGKYVEKAEDYLHEYHSSQSKTTTTTINSGHSSTTTTTTTHSSTHLSSDGGDGHAGGGYGEYFKMAEGFLLLHSLPICNKTLMAYHI